MVSYIDTIINHNKHEICNDIKNNIIDMLVGTTEHNKNIYNKVVAEMNTSMRFFVIRLIIELLATNKLLSFKIIYDYAKELDSDRNAALVLLDWKTGVYAPKTLRVGKKTLTKSDYYIEIYIYRYVVQNGDLAIEYIDVVYYTSINNFIHDIQPEIAESAFI